MGGERKQQDESDASHAGSGHLSAQDLSVMAQTFWSAPQHLKPEGMPLVRPELTNDELRDLFQSVCRNRTGVT